MQSAAKSIPGSKLAAFLCLPESQALNDYDCSVAWSLLFQCMRNSLSNEDDKIQLLANSDKIVSLFIPLLVTVLVPVPGPLRILHSKNSCS